MSIGVEHIDPARTGLVIVDLTNDFVHASGAYARGGQASTDMAALPQRVLRVANAVRDKGGWIISAQFTLVPGKDGEPFISPHLKQLRPFLAKGDFAPNSWGNALVEKLQPADLIVEKVAYSAFYMTRLEWLLRKAGIDTLMVCGIVTNGGVASTVRDAHVRDIQAFVLTDGCAAFSSQMHQHTIHDLSTIAKMVSCDEAVSLISKQ